MFSPPPQLQPRASQLQPLSRTHFFASGDVTVHDSAAIAPGVLLKADPGSRIVIGAGVCIGIGSIIHAREGTIEVSDGASLGAEVLIVGTGKIGAKSCVGSATTVFNASVEYGQVIPPGSLLGESGRQANVEELQVTDTIPLPEESVLSEPSTTEPSQTEAMSDPWQDESSSPAAQPPSVGNVQVYGKVYVNQLLVKMFPNGQSWNSNAEEGQPPLSLG